MHKSLELSHSDHEKLINYCGDCGIKFLSTGLMFLTWFFYIKFRFYKIPSGDLTNYFLLEKAGGSGKISFSQQAWLRLMKLVKRSQS